MPERVIEGHEHCRIDMEGGQLLLMWPEKMDLDSFEFIKHIIDTMLIRKERQIKGERPTSPVTQPWNWNIPH